MQKLFKLISIPFSHYNDKARWGLEHFKISYEEKKYLPGFHIFPVFWESRRNADASADRNSSKFSTPVLVTPNGQRLCDSGRILRYLDKKFGDSRSRLFTSLQATQLENRYSDLLGPHTRRIAYAWLLDDQDLLFSLIDANVSKAQALSFRLVWPLLQDRLKSQFDLTAQSVENSLAFVRKEIREADRFLESKNFLVGDHFSAADLAWSSMLAPAIWVSQSEGYGAWLPEASALRISQQNLVSEFRRSRSGQHAIAMYRDKRASPI